MAMKSAHGLDYSPCGNPIINGLAVRLKSCAFVAYQPKASAGGIAAPGCNRLARCQFDRLGGVSQPSALEHLLVGSASERRKLGGYRLGGLQHRQKFALKVWQSQRGATPGAVLFGFGRLELPFNRWCHFGEQSV